MNSPEIHWRSGLFGNLWSIQYGGLLFCFVFSDLIEKERNLEHNFEH